MVDAPSRSSRLDSLDARMRMVDLVDGNYDQLVESGIEKRVSLASSIGHAGGLQVLAPRHERGGRPPMVIGGSMLLKGLCRASQPHPSTLSLPNPPDLVLCDISEPPPSFPSNRLPGTIRRTNPWIPKRRGPRYVLLCGGRKPGLWPTCMNPSEPHPVHWFSVRTRASTVGIRAQAQRHTSIDPPAADSARVGLGNAHCPSIVKRS
jgi:hypothetical protein